jgi:nucleoside-diphosphate-sugar epimerase
VLEAIRAQAEPPPIVITSTNRSTAASTTVSLRLDGQCYAPVSAEIAAHGISEGGPLDFHSPYGCSKGTADQYVHDYARSYGLRTVVFRMSCIYGQRQFGTEDQGWVAHFLLRALDREPITLFGDGKQVRDILFVDDLVDAFLLADRNMERLSGQAFNIGGGPGQRDQPARPARPHRGARRPPTGDLVRGLAHRRPALLRVRHAPLPGSDRMEARASARRKARSASTAGCASCAASSAAAAPPTRALRLPRRRRKGGGLRRRAPMTAAPSSSRASADAAMRQACAPA